MLQLIYDIALRLGLGLILALLLILITSILSTAFYNQSKKIHITLIFFLLALIIYALGDIAIDILKM
ncbi:MAG: hypothetical protein J5U17_10835 [Candidatus Methanoperedens sp.]|nr:hypothetical protein [Candidatus Methanoperedens sp.]MCE8429063.1 hypothetical protein [Candidatus Methanoperedens sp.]